MTDKKHIIIIGAGFGGITAALTLEKHLGRFRDAYKIILIDRHRHHLYTPALYEIAALPRTLADDTELESSILIPISSIVQNCDITSIADELTDIDRAAHTITLARSGTMPYEFLVLALGSETNYFGIPELKERSFPLKTCQDAIDLRNKIEELTAQKNAIHIVIGGAGASGVELVAEFVNFICMLKKNDGGRSACATRFTLIEAGPDILAGFEKHTVTAARKRLTSLGIEIKTGNAISTVDEARIMLKNEESIPYDILIWTGGAKGPALFAASGLAVSPKGSIVVNSFLEAEGGDGRIYAIGDNAYFINPQTGKPIIWNVPVAESEGRLVARNILRVMAGKQKKPFRPLKKYPFILALGKKYAVADLIYVRFCGFLGWLAKQLVELRYFFFILPAARAMRLWIKNFRLYSSND